jgi:AraC-like DNA-binding protein
MRAPGRPEWMATASSLDLVKLSRWRTGQRAVSTPTGWLKQHAFGDPAAVSELELVELAWLQVARITAQRHQVVYKPATSSIPSIAITLQIAGTTTVDQCGRVARLAAGSWSVCTSSDTYTLASPSPSQRLVLLLPANRIDRGLDLHGVTARAFSGTSGVSRVAFGAVGWLMEELSTLGMVRADDLADSISRLLNVAIHERTRQLPFELSQRTLADRIRDYVTQHLHDPDLSIDSIARDLNASKRSLHRAVSDFDDSIHNLIWHARLDRCREDLRDPVKSQQSIAGIAQSWGFKNSTHFSRAFRTRFGMSAREARREAPGPERLESGATEGVPQTLGPSCAPGC